VKDHRVTRHFYEDLIGLPLVATWAEEAEIDGQKVRFAHTFYELADGSAMAFFGFEKDEDWEKFGARFRPTIFDHFAMMVDPATQDEIRVRLEANGFQVYLMDHGYVRSIYVTDPDGLNLEFSVDPPNLREISERKRALAREELDRWVAGDRRPNNDLRNH
jgi:catechol 2,3-dioxygenase-like lactoylglutathione lyase family enzyme